jgi:hypothetical protein
MNRRYFLNRSAVASAGCLAMGKLTLLTNASSGGREIKTSSGLHELFRTPGLGYHPYVRWWWNGDKVEAKELIRELRLLRDAGIGGVEINPIEFPTRWEGDDLGKPSLRWLGDEWIEMLKVVFSEAKSLGMTVDLIVGSGWPFGAEYLKAGERSQIAVIAVKKITGPADYEISQFEIFREADPAVSSPFTGRTMELLSLRLVPDPLTDIGQVIDLSKNPVNETFKITVPEGKHALCALVRINGFMQVINGAPGATGPVLNHYDREAVSVYLNRMSNTIQSKTGPLSDHIRALFTDSMELEGANWYNGIMDEFQKRKGYDLFPYLPFVLFKTGAMGNVTDFKYGVTLSPELDDVIKRMRYDFEVFKADILKEGFIKTFGDWCRGLNVKSRAQAYGRGFFPLESSFAYDIPECESWTMNWLKHRIGEEMPEDDYRRGRSYTMINKYVSSAANLSGKRLVSCEEMTDTYTVFNTSLENLKIGGEQSAISGVTHSIFHGFNYSPPEAPYPGWIRYGAYYNEKNTWWPYFHLFNEYKGRISALLQHADMFTDIAILPAVDDMWSLIGSQMEPFPSILHVDWLSLVWEAINKNGGGCDYVSQRVIRDSEMRNGFMHFGSRKYNSLILVQVDSLDVATAVKLADFVESGGRIFCIEAMPSKSLGWKNHEHHDKEVHDLVDKMKSFPDRFIFLQKPEKDFISWYGNLQRDYGIGHYLQIANPDPYVYQNRYRTDDESEIVFIINSHIHNSHQTRITFSQETVTGKHCFSWDPETGNRYLVSLTDNNSLDLDMGPASSFFFVFEKRKIDCPEWKQLAVSGTEEIALQNGWSVEFIHCHDGSIKNLNIDTLKDLKEMPDVVNFAGTVIYRNKINIDKPECTLINLGKVWGVSELTINGKSAGVKWYGRRIFSIGGMLIRGINTVEIKVVTSMGNYMKSLTDNPVAQYWTNEKNKVQPLQSMGLIGPVTMYKV